MTTLTPDLPKCARCGLPIQEGEAASHVGAQVRHPDPDRCIQLLTMAHDKEVAQIREAAAAELRTMGIRQLIEAVYGDGRILGEWLAREEIVRQIVRAKREVGVHRNAVFFNEVWPAARDALLKLQQFGEITCGECGATLLAENCSCHRHRGEDTEAGR